MIGAGQYVRLILLNGDELVHEGILEPGSETAMRFSDGPVTVSGFEIQRLTKDEVARLDELRAASQEASR